MSDQLDELKETPNPETPEQKKSKRGRPVKVIVPPITEEQLRQAEELRKKEAYRIVAEDQQNFNNAAKQAMKEIEEFADSKLRPLGLRLGVRVKPIEAAIALLPLNS